MDTCEEGVTMARRVIWHGKFCTYIAPAATVPGKEGLQLMLQCIGQLADKKYQGNATLVSGTSLTADFLRSESFEFLSEWHSE